MKTKKTLLAVTICLLVAFAAVAVGCKNGTETPANANYKIEVYAEQQDGSFVKTNYDGNGKIGDDVVVDGGSLTGLNAIPKGYYFDETDTRNALTGKIAEDGELTLTAYLKLLEYDVVFKDEDGTVLQSGKVKYGVTPVCNVTPAKEADKTYTYAFKSWDKAIVACSGDVTYTAVYEGTYIEYTITFEFANGEEAIVRKYHYGDAVTPPANPTKAADNTYTYTFKSWDKTVVACEADATYTAVYDGTYIDYTVTFDFDNGSNPLVTEYHYGDAVTTPVNPTKEGYTFIGWNKEVSDVCTGSVTYTATYAKNVEYMVKHYRRSIFGYVTLVEEEMKNGTTLTDVETYKKEYDGIVCLNFEKNEDDNVVEFYYGLEGTIYNVPNFTATGYETDGYTEKGTVTANEGREIYENVYEASVSAGTSGAFLAAAYGDNSGKWMLIPIKQNYGYIGGTLQIVDGKNEYHSDDNYPLWFDKDGNAIAYSTANKDWMTMAIYLDAASYPAGGNISINLFLWRLGTVQVGEYTYITQAQFDKTFEKTYSTVNHYVRNVNGSYTLADTETNVTCVITPAKKTYAGHVYTSLNVSGTVCDMYYELEGVTFNSATDIYKWKNVATYRIIDGETITEGQYRPTTKKIETISQSGDGAYLGIKDIKDKAGKYLVFAIKNNISAVDPTVPQCNAEGNASLTFYDETGNVVTYDKSKSDIWYTVVIEITDALAAKENIGLDFFCWSGGSILVGDYAFLTSAQLNALLPAKNA